jgi:uncharacterized protein (TIGR02646 family)
MIRMDRPVALAPGAWVTKATTEQQKVLAAFAAYVKKRKKKKTLEFSFEFAAYGDELLRDAINTVYQFKCAYCETFYGATQPVAVEHYRPKGAYKEGKKLVKPGYYWLAADWVNLVPSCTDCNSPRRHRMEATADKVLRGKGNFFPLEPKTRRAKKPGQEQREKPLLLHPELDDPEKHLEFLTAHDRVGVVRAALVGNTPSAKGEATIDVCALDRPQLTAARNAHAKRLLVHIRNTRDSMERHQANPADPNLERAYDQNVSDLLELYLAPTNPYCGMARQIARAELPGLQI